MAEIDHIYGGYADIVEVGEVRPFFPSTQLSGKARKALEEGQARARLHSRDLLRKSEALARERGWVK